jgi:Tol biopolymer transport system component/serine/threonine protein kinase
VFAATCADLELTSALSDHLRTLELAPGSRLGPYQITARLGAGGMGEVFRAHDTRLERSVAIKVLPGAASANPELRARLEREARSISQLNHPNICTLHDIGSEAGHTFLVMELIEGETLAARVARGPLPLRDVLLFGAQIADALDRAHRAGIVHRDLKPGNVMITKTGVKLLDFGLARQTVARMSHDAPTIQQPLSDPGMILGTLPYMAPEQLEGEDVDSRADIFALGAVLYEMATGVRAFTGSSQASLIANLLEHDPPALRDRGAVAPPLFEHIVTTCLRKDREARFQSAADVAHELRWLEQHRETPTLKGDTPAVSSGRRLWPVLALLAIAGLLGVGFLFWRSSSGTTAPIANAAFRQLTFDRGDEREPALSPDGKMFVFVKKVGGQADIFLQRVDGRTAINLTNEPRFDDTEPAFSPDGSLLAFRSERDGGGIFLMGATGESVRRLTDQGYNPAWSSDGKQLIVAEQRHVDPTFVYGIHNLHVVDVASGSIRRFYGGLDVLQPRWSPHGKRVAYWSPTRGTRDLFTIGASGDEKSVVPITSDRATDWSPTWSPDGNYVYFSSDRGGSMNLWRAPLDEETGATRGPLEAVRVPARYAGYPTMSSDGSRLLYQADAVRNEILRIDVDDSERVTVQEEPIVSGSMTVRYTAISPDGKTLAFMAATPEEDLYIAAADGTGLRQITNDDARDRGVAWTPDGSRILFYSNRTGLFQAFSVRPDGSGLRQITNHRNGVNFPRLSPDGRFLAYVPDGKGSAEIAAMRADGTADRGVVIPDVPGGRFVPRGWSPNQKLLLGGRYGGSGLFVYDLTAKRMTDFGIAARTANFKDDRRVVFVDTSYRIGVLDVVSRDVRYVGALPAATSGDWAFLQTDGRTITVIRTIRDSDVWLMELATEK